VMTKEEAISLAKSRLTEEMKSRSSSGHAVRIDRDYVTSNAEWFSKLRATVEQKLGRPFLPTDETAVVPHWLVTFTVLARERNVAALKHVGFEIHDDGTVQQRPIWSPCVGVVLGLDDQGRAGTAT
jgi:hypothetical protein